MIEYHCSTCGREVGTPAIDENCPECGPSWEIPRQEMMPPDSNPAWEYMASVAASRCADIIDVLLPPGCKGTVYGEFYIAIRRVQEQVKENWKDVRKSDK